MEEELVLWTIQKEITDTENASELFRMQSVATQLIFKIFFGRGMVFFKSTVTPLIDTITKMKQDKLELVPNGITVSVDEAQENLKFFMETIHQLFDRLESKIKLIPRVLRKAFRYIQVHASEKFPEIELTVVPIFFFLRCLCPCLMQPEQLGIFNERPILEFHLALLIKISKILQLIANGIVKQNITTYKPHHNYLINFMSDTIGVTKSFCEKLIEEDASDSCSPISDQSKDNSYVKLSSFILGKFRKHLDKFHIDYMNKMESDKEKKNSVTTFLKAFQKETEWKKLKDTEHIKAYISKSVTPLFRVEGKFSIPIEIIKSNVFALTFNNWMQIFKDNCLVTEKCKFISQTTKSETWSLKLKFPFPLSDKTVVVEKMCINLSDNEFALYIASAGTSQTQFDMCFVFSSAVTSPCIGYYRPSVYNAPQSCLYAIGRDFCRVNRRLSKILSKMNTEKRKSKSAQKKTFRRMIKLPTDIFVSSLENPSHTPLVSPTVVDSALTVSTSSSTTSGKVFTQYNSTKNTTTESHESQHELESDSQKKTSPTKEDHSTSTSISNAKKHHTDRKKPQRIEDDTHINNFIFPRHRGNMSRKEEMILKGGSLRNSRSKIVDYAIFDSSSDISLMSDEEKKVDKKEASKEEDSAASPDLLSISD
eukprot:TRINITY_DN5659_c0_g1_i1.p1 TRINITY_DN5659_c0_g1~~TRINITY_DN5659_c0_g1_i1.p1  ORF type:complete len:723 (-),score=156.42 TRINITY_DN5659_c0_g1_i1:36-1988(-)